MEALSKLELTFQAWQAGLDASDHLTLMAIGFGLMIFAVAALLWQRLRASNENSPTRDTVVKAKPYVVPGERHVKSRQKGDAFMRRIDNLAA